MSQSYKWYWVVKTLSKLFSGQRCYIIFILYCTINILILTKVTNRQRLKNWVTVILNFIVLSPFFLCFCVDRRFLWSCNLFDIDFNKLPSRLKWLNCRRKNVRKKEKWLRNAASKFALKEIFTWRGLLGLFSTSLNYKK